MMTFQDTFNEVLHLAQLHGFRHLYIGWMRKCLDERGFKGCCILCGKSGIKQRGVSGRKDGRYFCSDECEAKFWQQYSWVYVRDGYLKAHPKCESCGSTAFLEVHHKLPIRLHPSIGQGEVWSHENLITLCHDCHQKEHQKLRKSVRATEFRKRIRTSRLDDFLSVSNCQT